MASEHIEQKLALLPDLPGSYQMKSISTVKLFTLEQGKEFKKSCAILF